MSSLIELQFVEYSKMLDEKNDKHERIYKTNRDITSKSKKIIFMLQRIPGLKDEEVEKIFTSATNEFKDVEQTLLKYIAMEIRDSGSYQFVNAYSAGIQEYIEALLFYHYLLKEEILPHSEVQKRVIFAMEKNEHSTEIVPLSVLIPPKEYMLGLADFSGELMRFCIKSLSAGNFDTCYKICDLLRLMNVGFLSLGHVSSKEFNNKIQVFRNSLKKVEDACYNIHLRKSELTCDMLGKVLTMNDMEERESSYF